MALVQAILYWVTRPALMRRASRVWVSPRSGQYSGHEDSAKILDCWYPASYLRAVREHLGRAQPPSELSQPSATNLLGAHVEFTSPAEAYAELSNALLASRLK